MSILWKLHNFADPQLDRMIQEIVLKINAISSGDFGAEAVGVAATLDAEHVTDFAHGDIAHTNRTALNAVSGTNTGDDKTSITGLLKGDGSAIFAATANTDYVPAVSGANTLTLLSTGAEINSKLGIGTTPTVGLEVGSISAGKSVVINATEGAEMAPALEAENWTVTGTNCSVGGGVIRAVASPTGGTFTPSGAFVVTIGRTYKVTWTVTASTPYTYGTLGGVSFREPLTNGTFTSYVTATTTAKIIITTLASAATLTITSLSVKELTPDTGDITAYGKFKITNGIYSLAGAKVIDINSQGRVGINMPASNAGYDLITNNHIRSSTGGLYGAFLAGTGVTSFLYASDANYTLAQRNGANQCAHSIYNTYTNATNYERLTLTGVAGASVNLTAETAGTGADNLNVVVSPAGLGLTILGGKIAMTPEGGFAVRYTNRTGGASVKGHVVTVSSVYDNAVRKIVVDVPDPIGVIYESGIADGQEVWVVVSGTADVYFIGSTTRGHLVRGFVTTDSGYVTGQALSEAVPTSPFATDKHFYEIGHVQESRTGAGLAKCTLHFN